ncbi:hypothetical protein SC81_22700, partial [Vibrio vulnificus]|uniref:type 1 fimbrial protein n=1 Tax=Vibrio vulnificus TaxID=672 RepID=UPI000CB9207D
STPLSDGQFASGAFNSYFLITYKDGLIASGTSSIRLTGSVTTINATCQVADQTVKLQSIAAARLNGVGTYAAVTPFKIVCRLLLEKKKNATWKIRVNGLERKSMLR